MTLKRLIALTLAGGFLLLSRPARADISSVLTFPEGSSGEVQYENDGLFAGDSTFTFDPSSNTLTVYRVDGTSVVISGKVRLSYLDCSSYSAGGTLTTDASGNVVCADDESSAGVGTPGGSNSNVQVNENGAHAGYSSLTYNATTQLLVVGSSVTVGGVRIGSQHGASRLYITSNTWISGELIVGGTAGGSNSGSLTLQDSGGNTVHQLSTISNATVLNQDNGARNFQVGTSNSDTTLYVHGSSSTVGVGTTRTTNTFNVQGDLGVYTTGQMRLYDADNSNYVAIRASNTVSSNVTFVLAADGTNGQALFTDGTGNLSFATLNAPQSSLGVEEGDVLVSSPTAALDFLAADFDLSESPSKEINISFATTSTKYIQNSTTPAGQVFSVASGTVAGNLTVGGTVQASGVTCTDCITLASETSGFYVHSLNEGLAIDVGAAAESGTPLVSFDPTELTGDRTFGNASDSTMTWTFNLSDGDPSIVFGKRYVAVTTMSVTDLIGSVTTLNGLRYVWPSTQTANKFLENNGSGGVSWQQVHLSSDVTGTLPLASGGTGVTAALDGHVLVGNGSIWVSTAIPNCGASEKLLFSTTTRQFSCATDITGAVPAIAVSTGGVIVSSPTLNINFLAPILGRLVGSTTAELRLDTSSVTMLGPTIVLGTETSGVYVASINATSPITVSTNGVAGSAPTIALTQGAGTDITGDIEEETHVTEHQSGGADELGVTGLSGLLGDAQKIIVSTGGTVVHTSTGLNFIAGSNVTLTGASNGGRTDITIAASITGSGGGSEIYPATATPSFDYGAQLSSATLRVNDSSGGPEMTFFNEATPTGLGYIGLATTYSAGSLAGKYRFRQWSSGNNGPGFIWGDSADSQGMKFDHTNNRLHVVSSSGTAALNILGSALIGSGSIGKTPDPDGLRVSGTSVFESSMSATKIGVATGTAALPSITANDIDTGIEFPAANNIELAVNGLPAFLIDPTAINAYIAGAETFNWRAAAFRGPRGATGFPSLSWRLDTNTGVENPSADVMSFLTGGSTVAVMNTGGFNTTGGLSASTSPITGSVFDVRTTSITTRLPVHIASSAVFLGAVFENVNQAAMNANYTVTSTDTIMLFSPTQNSTATLPAASGGRGRLLSFKKIDTSSTTVTIKPAGSDTIDGFTTWVLSKPNEYLTIVSSNSTNWSVIADNNDSYTPMYVGWNQTLVANSGVLSASRTVHMPVDIPQRCQIAGIRYIVGTQSGNVSLSIYDRNGYQIATSSAVACPASGLATTFFTSTVTVQPGFYYLSIAADNTTATFGRTSSNNSPLGAGFTGGSVGTFPSPATVTFPPTVQANWLALVGVVVGPYYTGITGP